MNMIEQIALTSAVVYVTACLIDRFFNGTTSEDGCFAMLVAIAAVTGAISFIINAPIALLIRIWS